jgi:hypothetical protein
MLEQVRDTFTASDIKSGWPRMLSPGGRPASSCLNNRCSVYASRPGGRACTHIPSIFYGECISFPVGQIALPHAPVWPRRSA